MALLDAPLPKLLADTNELPSMPTATLAVIQEVESTTSSAQSVAFHLSQDQALAARVLRLANSAYYGLQRQVADLQDAVVVLGMRTVHNLAMVASAYPMLIGELKGYRLGAKDLWTHASGVAVASKLISETTRKGVPDHAFTLGLIHDLGKVVLNVWLKGRETEVLRRADQENLPLDVAERALLGFDHAEVGAELMERWHLPSAIVEAVRYHHRPELCPAENPLGDIVHLGGHLALDMGLMPDGLPCEFDASCLLRLGVSEETLQHLRLEFEVSYRKYERLFEDLALAA